MFITSMTSFGNLPGDMRMTMLTITLLVFLFNNTMTFL